MDHLVLADAGAGGQEDAVLAVLRRRAGRLLGDSPRAQVIRVEAVIGAHDHRGLAQVHLAQQLAQHQVVEAVAHVEHARVELEVSQRLVCAWPRTTGVQ